MRTVARHVRPRAGKSSGPELNAAVTAAEGFAGGMRCSIAVPPRPQGAGGDGQGDPRRAPLSQGGVPPHSPVDLGTAGRRSALIPRSAEINGDGRCAASGARRPHRMTGRIPDGL
ncbi:hypothetical protein GCM10009605_21630 [Nocardiopsis composta]